MRGEAAIRRVAAEYGGIIPAGAGRRPSRLKTIRPRWDHPRGCGEKIERSGKRFSYTGSSPRVRGEVLVGFSPLPQKGIIPAGAGRSQELDAAFRLSRDHPRGCGEKPRIITRKLCSLGSSPRVRGEGPMPLFGTPGLGIIPAGAGRSRAT